MLAWTRGSLTYTHSLGIIQAVSLITVASVALSCIVTDPLATNIRTDLALIHLWAKEKQKNKIRVREELTSALPVRNVTVWNRQIGITTCNFQARQFTIFINSVILQYTNHFRQFIMVFVKRETTNLLIIVIIIVISDFWFMSRLCWKTSPDKQ